MMNLRIFSLASLMLALGATAAGCGGGGDSETDTKSTPDDKTKAGETACGQVTCQAGQYCDNMICANGCLANTNCGDDQTCVKEGSNNVGACKNTTNTATGPTLEQFCAKADACSSGWSAAQCKQVYDGTNEACHTCVVNANCGGDCNADCDW